MALGRRSEVHNPRAFTGTAIWIDPGQDLFVIFSSNRVHPAGKVSVTTLIGRIGTVAAADIK